MASRPTVGEQSSDCRGAVAGQNEKKCYIIWTTVGGQSPRL